MTSSLKKCSKCGKEKELEEFYKRSSTVYRTTCKECHTKYTTEYYKNHQKQIKKKRVLYNKANRDRIKERKSNYYKQNPDKLKDVQLKITYGLSKYQYDTLLLKQSNTCYMCGLPFTPSGKHKINVDHDHNTGKVRKLLHAHCNYILGILENYPDLLEKAANYKKEHEQCNQEE